MTEPGSASLNDASPLPAQTMWNSTSPDVDGLERTGIDTAYHCDHGALLGPLGLFVQALLAFIAFSALIGK